VGWPTRAGGPNRRIGELPLSMAIAGAAGQIWRAGGPRPMGEVARRFPTRRHHGFWGSERSGSHRGRRSTVVAAGRRGMTVEARAGAQGARRLVGELLGTVLEHKEVRMGLGTACSSGALRPSGGTPSGHRLGSRTAPARRRLRAWRSDGGGRLLLRIKKCRDAQGIPT
jgi:hypothetical protein